VAEKSERREGERNRSVLLLRSLLQLRPEFQACGVCAVAEGESQCADRVDACGDSSFESSKQGG
jgi:hypothetical protein